MEHTNLFLYATQQELVVDYPDGKVDSPVPGVAYARDEKIVLFNKKKVSYEVTVCYEDRSGNTMAPSTTIYTPEALEGNTAKVVIYPVEVEEAKPISGTQKIGVSADTEFTFLYYVLTSYTVTVNHMFSGQSIACATTVEVEDVYEEDVVNVKIEPLSIPGYTAEAVYIRVSGDTTYDLEYEEIAYLAIDLGLPSGTLWCDRNVGASSPEGFGGYYAWGEVEEKDTYSRATYRFFDSSDSSYTKYNSTDEKYVLDPEDDVACVEMGGDWHIPTTPQIEELMDYTTSAITTLNGVSGITLTSTENGNSIFLPFAGYKFDEDEGEFPEDADFIILFTSMGRDDTCGGLLAAYYQGQSFVQFNPMPRFTGASVRGVIGDGPTFEPVQPTN